MIECAEQTEGQWAMEAMLLLAQAETDMKLSPRPKTQLEAALVKLCVPKMSQGEVQLLKRIRGPGKSGAAWTADASGPAASAYDRNNAG